jgi:hypothetical protein
VHARRAPMMHASAGLALLELHAGAHNALPRPPQTPAPGQTIAPPPKPPPARLPVDYLFRTTRSHAVALVDTTAPSWELVLARCLGPASPKAAAPPPAIAQPLSDTSGRSRSLQARSVIRSGEGATPRRRGCRAKA